MAALSPDLVPSAAGSLVPADAPSAAGSSAAAEAEALHLLLSGGTLLPSPRRVSRDGAGARLLAEEYAVDAARVSVRAMMNTTIDGAIAGADGTSGPLRNPDDSFAFGVLRALTDVVVAGAATVRTEDYRRPRGRGDLLEPSRRPAGAARPALAVWTSSGELPESVEADWPTFALCPPGRAAAVRDRSGLPADQVLAVSSGREAIAALAALGMRAIQLEGGPSRLGALVAEGVVDELCFSTTHRTVGGPSPRVLDAPAHDAGWALRSLLVGKHATLARYARTR